MVGPVRCFCVALTVGIAAPLCGCVLGPAALEASRIRYNQVIQATTSEQLLLNLVRLHYREPPLFLEVGSVSAQFVFKESADVAGLINEGPGAINPDRLDLGVGIGFEERPTVTLTPLQGSDFVNQLLSPLQLDVLVLLSRSGWSIDRVLRLTLQTMNGLDNASTASGPTPKLAPRYRDFARVSDLLRELQKGGLLELGYETRRTDLSSPLPIEQVRLPDIVDAVDRGFRLRPADDGKSLTLTGTSRVLVWRVPPSAVESAVVREIVELLGLEPRRSAYEIQLSAGGQPDAAVAAGQRTQIYVATRSLLGSLFYLSQAVEVPEAHRARGLVTTTVTADGEPFDWHRVIGDLLGVHSQRTRPPNAAVAVRHRGYWYYIDDADLSSKSTFSLLSQLFALQAGEIKGAVPVLTLPVGG